MAASPQTGMDKAELKTLLIKSKKEPVNCAIGIGRDQQAVIMLHKTKQPRAVLQDLEKQVGVVKNPCYGSAFVDVDDDPKLAILTLNKAAGGLAAKLKKTLKGTGFTKVTIKLEDGTIAEAAGEDEEEGSPQPSDGSESPEAEQQQDAAPVDFAALHKELATLIPQIPTAAANNPARLEELKKLAGAANTAIKGNDGPGATTALDAFRAALSPNGSAPKPTSSPPPGPQQGEFVTMQKSRLIWDSARKRVASEIKSLKDAVRQEFDGDPEESTALDALDGLDEIAAKFDERLIDTLDEMLNETDPKKRTDLRTEAQQLIQEYVDYAKSNELIQKLDGDTPLGVKLSIGSTITATLKALQTSLR